MTTYTSTDRCRACKSSDFERILSLGTQHVSDHIEPGDETVQAPVEVLLCGACGLVQLEHTVDPEWLFNEDYGFKSGVNETMIAALEDVAYASREAADLPIVPRPFSPHTVLDIGCNDGTLLEQFPGCQRIGFEPVKSVASEAAEIDGAVTIHTDFFDADTYLAEHDPADLITSVAMFYSVDDPNTFVEGVEACLAPDGVWALQMGYNPMVLKRNAFDTFCHHHIEYYSLIPFERLIERHGLDVFDVTVNDVNEGSVRVFVRHRESAVRQTAAMHERVEAHRARERRLGLLNPAVWGVFADRIAEQREQTVGFIEDAVTRGETVHAYGASTKGNVLLQHYGLDNALIEAAAERDPRKYGKVTAGTDIPIVPEAESRPEADYYLVLPWHLMDGFVDREAEWLRDGGAFIKPLPEFELIGAEALDE